MSLSVRYRGQCTFEPRSGILKKTYDRVMVGKSIVNGHVFEEPTDVLVKETLDFCEVEFRVDEDGAKIGFYNVRKTLAQVGQLRDMMFELVRNVPLEDS